MAVPLTEALVQTELTELMVAMAVVAVYMVHLELPVDLVAMVALPEGVVAVAVHNDLVMPTLVPEVLAVQEKFGFGL